MINQLLNQPSNILFHSLPIYIYTFIHITPTYINTIYIPLYINTIYTFIHKHYIYIYNLASNNHCSTKTAWAEKTYGLPMTQADVFGGLCIRQLREQIQASLWLTTRRTSAQFNEIKVLRWTSNPPPIASENLFPLLTSIITSNPFMITWSLLGIYYCIFQVIWYYTLLLGYLT